MIAIQLSCLDRSKSALTFIWTFDDGTTAQGRGVIHLFPRTGMRTIHLSMKDGEKEVATLTQTINVHPDWLRNWKGPELRPEQEAEIMGRDLATFSVSDLAGCVAVFEHYRRSDDLLKLLPLVCARMNAFNEADLPYLKNAALFLAREDWAHAAEAIQLLRALIDRPAPAQPSPQLIGLAGECRLELARLLLKSTNQRTKCARSSTQSMSRRSRATKTASSASPRRPGSGHGRCACGEKAI